jgi:hypothetical protein
MTKKNLHLILQSANWVVERLKQTSKVQKSKLYDYLVGIPAILR